MNGLAKIVFSRTLERAEWHNTRLVKTDPAAEVGRLKRQDGKHAIVLGSSDLATTLADRGLIDEYRIMFNPIALAENHSSEVCQRTSGCGCAPYAPSPRATSCSRTSRPARPQRRAA